MSGESLEGWLQTARRTVLAILAEPDRELRDDQEEAWMHAINQLAGHDPDWLRAHLADANWPLPARQRLAGMLLGPLREEAASLLTPSETRRSL